MATTERIDFQNEAADGSGKITVGVTINTRQPTVAAGVELQSGSTVSNAAWASIEAGLPRDNAVTQLADTADTALKFVDGYLNQAYTVASTVERLAPLYANAEAAVTRAIVEAARQALYSVQLNGHVLAADVPFGFTGVGAANDAAFRAQFERYAPTATQALVDLPRNKGGAPALKQKLLASLTDSGDHSKPYLEQGTAVAGVSIVIGIQDIESKLSSVRDLWQQIAKLLALGSDLWNAGKALVARILAPPFAMKKVFRPENLRVRNVVHHKGYVVPLLEWDAPEFPPNNGAVEWTEGTENTVKFSLVKPPLKIELWATNKPSNFYALPPIDSLPVNLDSKGAVTDRKDAPADGSWYLLDTKYYDSLSLGYLGRLADDSWFLSPAALRGTAGDTEPPKHLSKGPLNQAAYALRYVFPDDSLEVWPEEIATPLSTQAVGAWSDVVVYTARPKPDNSATSQSPDWHAFGTRNISDDSPLLAPRTAIDEFIGLVDAKVLTRIDMAAQDSSDTIVKTARSTKEYITAAQNELSEIRQLIAKIKGLAQFQMGVYARAFQYAAPFVNDAAQPTGLAALTKEYNESMDALPFQGEQDMVFGMFLVMTAPANAASQLKPVLDAIAALLGLASLTGAEAENQAAQAAARGREMWEHLTGEPEPTDTPGLDTGAATAPLTTTTAPAIGADDVPGLDLNCPPARDLSRLTFSDALVPSGV